VTLPNCNDAFSNAEEIPKRETKRTSLEKQNTLVMEYALENGSMPV